MKMWKKIKKGISWIWQLPQNILAIFLKNILCSNSCYYSKKINEEVEAVVNIIYPNPFSLGNYIFISNNTSNKTIKHELGHCRQSRVLGPLYLLVIGLPSMIHCIIYNICKSDRNYNDFYTEKWLMN